MPPQQPNTPFQPYPVGQGAPLQPIKPQKSKSIIFIIIIVILALSLVGALGFGLWAFSNMQNYKINTDQISAKAVEIAVQKESTRKDNEFVEKEKSPLKNYNGPASYGSISVSYPKTWGGYVVETDSGAKPIDGYFHPNFVPGLQSKTTYALRIEISSQSYDQEMKQFEAKVKTGKVKVSPYIAPNVPNVTGARVEGEINTGQNDSMVLLPLRDKTIKISTEAQQYIGDFNNIILANLKFVP